MTRTTTASLAYIATQVYFHPSSFSLRLTIWQLRFALSSSSVFCRTDTSTDSERFYESVLDFLDHPDEENEVRDLLNWWNWWVLVSVACFWIPLNWYFDSWQPSVPELRQSWAHHYRDQCISQAEGKEGTGPASWDIYLIPIFSCISYIPYLPGQIIYSIISNRR